MAPGLRHAPWGGWPTPADFVFPFFLVLVGVATPLALRRRVAAGASQHTLLSRAARRAAVLFGLGVFLNLFPQFDVATVRIPGVLQRIAVVSLACVAAYLWLRPRNLAAVIVGLLVIYTAALRLVPVPGVGEVLLTPEAHLPAWLDDRVFAGHTWRGPGDPEGILSSLGAVATGLVGVLAGLALGHQRPVRRLQLGGLCALTMGAVSLLVVPLAKDVWTAPYALITAGVALLFLAGLERADLAPGRGRSAVELFGRQALTAYILAHLLSDVSIHVLRWADGETTHSLHTLVHRGLLTPWLPDTAASLVYSLIMLAVVWLVVWGLDRRGFRLRI